MKQVNPSDCYELLRIHASLKKTKLKLSTLNFKMCNENHTTITCQYFSDHNIVLRNLFPTKKNYIPEYEKGISY